MKKTCVDNNKINGNISKIKEGEFKIDKYIGRNVLVLSKSLKNSNSLNILRINTKLNIIRKTYKKFFTN